jgi:hypothetical protein
MLNITKTAKNNFLFILLLFCSFCINGCTKNQEIVSTDIVAEESTPSETPGSSDSEAPLPSAWYMVTLFFELINDRKISEAINLMTPEMIGDESSKQTWEEHFNAIKSINIQEMEFYDKENWTSNTREFKVTLEAYVSTSKSAPIPYYGWHDNPNVRWITLEKNSEGFWEISSIATGP